MKDDDEEVTFYYLSPADDLWQFARSWAVLAVIGVAVISMISVMVFGDL